MSRRSTLDKPICTAADAMDQHTALLALANLLQQLWHHHVSMAKPQSTSCSKEYNQELADCLAFHLGWRSTQPERKFDPSGKKNELGKLSDAMSMQESVTRAAVLEQLNPWLKHAETCKARDVIKYRHNQGGKWKCTCGLIEAMAGWTP